MRYKHIVFDIDGTLIDTEHAVIYSLIDTVREMTGREIRYDDLKFVLGITGRKALELLKLPDVERGLDLWEENMGLYRHTVRPFDGMEECLKQLSCGGYRLGIVTSKTHAEYCTDFEPFGLSKYFATIVCADDTIRHKPDGDPLLAYLAKAHASSSETLYVGDSIYDIQCAAAAKVASGLALWCGNVPTGVHADYCFENPGCVADFLSASGVGSR